MNEFLNDWGKIKGVRYFFCDCQYLWHKYLWHKLTIERKSDRSGV